MGEMKIKIPDNLDNLFRRIAMKKFGYRKGAISYAAKEALEDWTATEEIPDKIEDPIEAISGIMGHVKKSSVQLQHEAWDYIAEKYDKKFRKKK